ncbi:MAG TPA: squalene/phytoene synthase family protein, partial [Bacteroidales bacterium]|nr:squalene/phytoene synthase family protein [Bacteroidales bacterium]
EVVGLMCLQVFTREKGNYQELVYYARKLGEAFQKINFLRDLKDDYIDRGRSYFPQVDMTRFDDRTKQELEKDIQHDFDESLIGIRKLPTDSRFGVYIAYFYYIHLFKKILKIKAEDLVRHRSRISNAKKLYLVVAAYFNHLIRKY